MGPPTARTTRFLGPTDRKVEVMFPNCQTGVLGPNCWIHGGKQCRALTMFSTFYPPTVQVAGLNCQALRLSAPTVSASACPRECLLCLGPAGASYTEPHRSPGGGGGTGGLARTDTDSKPPWRGRGLVEAAYIACCFISRSANFFTVTKSLDIGACSTCYGVTSILLPFSWHKSESFLLTID
jgi:hypothetical protein